MTVGPEEIAAVAITLIGPTSPVGETHEDAQRLENVRVLASVVESLLMKLESAAEYKDRPEASMRAIGREARNALNRMKEYHCADD